MSTSRSTEAGGTLLSLSPNMAKKAGQIGIEIEVEASNDLPASIGQNWTATTDGSLRGSSLEYVLQTPCALKHVRKNVNHLKRAIENHGADVLYTGRAGTHIHINVQELTVTQIYSFICLYLILEDVLLTYCGKDREGNLFCLKAKDAEYLVDALKESVVLGSLKTLNTNDLRYAAINVNPLFSYGSLEFRSMRSTLDAEVLGTWAEILSSIKDAAVSLGNPINLIEELSQLGPLEFFNTVLPSHQKLFSKIPDIAERVYEGVQRVQSIAFASDWKTPISVSSGKRKSFIRFSPAPTTAHIEFN